MLKLLYWWFFIVITQQEAEQKALEHYYLIKHKVKLPGWPEPRQVLSVSSILGTRDINNTDKNIYSIIVLCANTALDSSTISLETALKYIL